MSKEERVWTTDKNCEVYYDGKYKAVVKIMDGFDYYEDFDPRFNSNIGKFCIRKHRDYTFPNELDFDFDAYDEDEIKIPEKNYYIFRLDCYNHGQIVFSFTGQGMQCRRDTSRWCGFIAVPKCYNGTDLREIHETKYIHEPNTDGNYNPIELTESRAREIAEGELKEFNQYNNGEIYGYTVYQKVLWTSETGEEKYEYEVLDSVGGYFDVDSCKEEAIETINAYKKEEVEG